MRSLQGKCLGEISDSRRERKISKQKGQSSNPSEKVAPAGRPIWPTKIKLPRTRHIGEKAKERKGRKENRRYSIPMMETKVSILDNGKGIGGHDKGKSKKAQPQQRTWSPPSSRLHHPQSVHLPVGQIKIGTIMEWSESGWHSSHETAQDTH